MNGVVTRAELLEGWSAEEIVTLAPALLAQAEVPAPTRHFLTEIGLPRTFPYFFTTVADRHQEPSIDVPDRASLIGMCVWREAEHLRLGTDYDQYVCVERRSGRVIQVPHQMSSRSEQGFVNSSVETFVAFLLRLRLRQLAAGLDKTTDEELEARAEVFRAALVQLDPAALSDEESYWSVIVEQMRYGHL